MKNIFQTVIKRGGYDLSEMLRKIDSYHISGKLSDQDRDELYTMARDEANPSYNLDFLNKLLEVIDIIKSLDTRIGRLENNYLTESEIQDDDGENDVVVDPENPKDPETTIYQDNYVAGKWYRTGDTVSFENKTYVCIAPEGMVCTWSPAEYPAYWNEEVAL